MPRTAHILLTLFCTAALAVVYAAGFLTNGYIERGKLLESYNGANRLRLDARAESQRADGVMRENAALKGALNLPEATPRSLDAVEGMRL